MDLQLKGRKAIVTGGTKGIGYATAKQLAEEGADVAICARNKEDLRRVVAEFQQLGVNSYGESVDMFEEEDYSRWLVRAARDLGGVDIFVSNVSAANSLGADGLKAWEEFFNIDLMCAVNGFNTLRKFLEESVDASVIFVGTTAAHEHFPLSPAGFMALKAALITQAKTLSKQFGKKGIRVNTVSPGPVYEEQGAWGQIEEAMPEVFNGVVKQIPLGRMAKPEEIARYIAFLASPAASFITGTNCIIDGGITQSVV